MPLSLAKRIAPGLFGKFLILMIGAGFLISMLLGLYWRHVAQPQFRGDFHGHIEYYQQLMARELGDPPDRRRAEDIASRLNMGLKFENSSAPGAGWQTKMFPQGYEEKQVNHIRKGQLLAAVKIPSGRLLFSMRMRGEIEGIHGVAMGAIVVAVLFLAWLVSRRLLKGVRELRAGMAAIESGRLDYRLDTKGADELTGLKRSFNSMTANLESMLRDRDRLLADVSHELRSPLTRLKVALEFNKDKKSAKTLRAEIAGMQTIIAALLDTERLATSSAEDTIDVSVILQSICREKKIPFTKNNSAPTVKGSAEKLRIVLRNLFENALKHGARPVTAELYTETGQLVIRIADAGAGITEAEKEKIFLPFYRTPGTTKTGYGLGLYMAKKIIESMRGTIAVAPSAAGTTIEIRLRTA